MRSEKGSITVYVLIAMLTFTAFLIAIYVRNSNKEMAQIETTEKIKAIYEDYDIDEVYATMKGQVPQILGYAIGAKEITIKTLVENGLNVDQNGREITYYAATLENVAPTDTSEVEGTFGVWQKSVDISLIGYEETGIYIWIKNEDGNISKFLDNPIETTEENEVVLSGTKAGKTLNYKIYGNSVQNGTPIPDVPVEIKSVGEYDEETSKYKIPIKVNDETTNIYLDEPLRKIGEYQDYIDFETQTISRRIVERTFDGSEGWFLGSGNNSYGNIMSLKIDHNRTSDVNALCNRCLAVAGSVATPTGSTMRMIYGGGYNYIYFFVPTSIATTATEWKTWLSENNLTVVYALKNEPEPTSIELPEIKTAEGTTSVRLLTNVLPSDIELSY